MLCAPLFRDGVNSMKNRQKISPWTYSLPALILIGIIVVFPILYTGYISLTNMNLYHWDDYHIIGLENFARALTKVDSGFLGALATTILWTVLNMVIQVVLVYWSSFLVTLCSEIMLHIEPPLVSYNY